MIRPGAMQGSSLTQHARLRVTAGIAVAVLALLPMLLSACSGGSRTQIRIVGSSTVYPFTTAVAEQFKRKAAPGSQ
jgi:ABC-type phosphate transport system substrate-binding protein